MIEFDSNEEKWFSWYLDDLMRVGAVIAWGRAQPFLLSEKVEYKWTRKMKTKEKKETGLLLHPHSYTPDFKVIWNPEYEGILFHYKTPSNFDAPVYTGAPKGKVPFVANLHQGKQTGTPYSIIEIKPAFTMGHDHKRESTINIKWVWAKYMVFVQQVVVKPSDGKPASALFPATFTPGKYLYTDKTRKPRKIAWEVITVSKYIEHQKRLRQFQSNM